MLRLNQIITLNLLNTDKAEHRFQRVYTPVEEVAINETTRAFGGYICIPV